ncbi:MAG: hypothetical protein RRB13_15065 [bacterium]|nr:hypothetical protein [bacterium]
MDNFMGLLRSVPGLGALLIFSGAVLMGLDIRKLYQYATMKDRPVSFQFYYLVPGMLFFALGFMVISP